MDPHEDTGLEGRSVRALRVLKLVLTVILLALAVWNGLSAGIRLVWIGLPGTPP